MLTGELWEGLSPEELEHAEPFCPERHFPEGATIFAPGDPSDALYVLKSGIVTLSHVSEDGQESILRVLIPGNVFGELFLTTPSRPFLARPPAGVWERARRNRTVSMPSRSVTIMPSAT